MKPSQSPQGSMKQRLPQEKLEVVQCGGKPLQKQVTSIDELVVGCVSVSALRIFDGWSTFNG